MSFAQTLSALDAAISRPMQKMALPRALEQLLALPGGRLFGKSKY
jgi:hypothetical protein